MIAAKQQAARTNPAGKRISNRVLLELPEEEFRIVRPHLSFVNFTSHLRLNQPNRALNFVHFPNAGQISLVIDMKNGKSVEAGLLGKEGASGMSAMLGLNRTPILEVVQIAGNGFRMRVSTLRDALRSTPRLQAALGRYSAGLAIQMAQTAACNRLHKVEERLARWLLMAQDRVDSRFIRITHDFLATMLGTDRPTVTLAAGILQKHGLVGHTRGALEIVNRKKLERVACECYGVVAEYNDIA